MFEPTAGCSSVACAEAAASGSTMTGSGRYSTAICSSASEMAVMRQHDRDRLADIAHPIDREAPMLHRGLDRDRERFCPAPRILARYNAADTGHRQRCRRVDRNQLGMSMRRAQDRGMQYS